MVPLKNRVCFFTSLLLSKVGERLLLQYILL